MDFESAIERLKLRVSPMSRFVHLLANTLSPPRFFPTGFRYEKPELIHFCLLRCVRIVSALNASIKLAECGYSQEIAVLLRTAIEYETQLDFMIANKGKNNDLSADAAAFVTSFFQDAHRPGSNENKKARLVQKKVHDAIGTRLDGLVKRPESARSASTMMSNVYTIFSNYVHAKYPESMDLYGRAGPGNLHTTISGVSA